jgi:hypothetical protein
MTSHRAFRVGAAAIMLTLIGCSGGDLTLPGPGPSGPDQPAALRVLSGDGQEAEVGTVLDDPLTVQVLDESSQPVPNVRVQFSFLGDIAGAALDPTSIETDEAGRAEAIVRLGERPGEQVIVAAVANTQQPDLRAQFSVTAVPPSGGDDDDDKKGGKGGHGGDGNDG